MTILPQVCFGTLSGIVGTYLYIYWKNNTDQNYSEDMQLDCWAMDSSKHKHDPDLLVYEIHETGTIPADLKFDINVTENFLFWF